MSANDFGLYVVLPIVGVAILFNLGVLVVALVSLVRASRPDDPLRGRRWRGMIRSMRSAVRRMELAVNDERSKEVPVLFGPIHWQKVEPGFPVKSAEVLVWTSGTWWKGWRTEEGGVDGFYIYDKEGSFVSTHNVVGWAPVHDIPWK